MTEFRSGWWEREDDSKMHKGTFWVMKIFYILIVVVII